MISFADQACQKVGPDLDPNCWTVFLKEFFSKKLILKKKISRQKKHENLPRGQRGKWCVNVELTTLIGPNKNKCASGFLWLDFDSLLPFNNLSVM